MAASCRSRTAAEYFEREIYKECVTLFQEGVMSCNGKHYPIPPKMTIPQDQQTSDRAFNYYEDKEYRLMICLEYPAQCK